MQQRIDINLEVNVHGLVEVSDLLMAIHSEHAKDLIVEKMCHQLNAAMREHLAEQLGAKAITPEEICEVRDLLEEALHAGFMAPGASSRVGRAYSILKRRTAKS